MRPTRSSGIAWCCLLSANSKGGRVGSRRDCTWILGLSGFRVVRMDESVSGRLVIGLSGAAAVATRAAAAAVAQAGCDRVGIGPGMTPGSLRGHHDHLAHGLDRPVPS